MSRTKKRKSTNHNHNNIYDLNQALMNNGKAIAEGPRRKNWTVHDLNTIKPLTPAQEEMFHEFFAGQHICAHGSAGTGKTFLAIYLALTELVRRDSPIERILLVRSAVATRELGHMPGDEQEKISVYEAPYADIFAQLCGRPTTYEHMKAAGVVKFTTTSFVRGVTWDDTIVIIDEGQNMNFHEIDSLMSRLGENSRIIFAGDLPQSDLLRSKNDFSGMDKFMSIAKLMREFSLIKFTSQDIVRSGFVKAWVQACEQYGERTY